MCPLYLVVEVEPNVSDFSTVLKHVVRDGDVVRSNFGRSVVVVVRGTTHVHTNATVNEGVVGDDVSFTALTRMHSSDH